MVPGSPRAQKAANNSKLYIFMCALRFFFICAFVLHRIFVVLNDARVTPKGP